jgi:5-methyltetrahydrofolate--homocysteine methyltransferase
MIYKEDWEKAKERFKAWWEGEIIDRVVIQVTAPRNMNANHSPDTPIWTEWDLVHNLSIPEIIVKNFERYCQNMYFGGEAFPNFWINFGPGVVSAFLGANPEIREDTVWFETPKDWDTIFQCVRYNPDNKWWNIVKTCTSMVTENSNNKFFAGLTDLGGNLDILAALRGTQNLLIDLIESEDYVKKVLIDINQLWFQYFDGLNQILEKKMEGTSNWMSLWSPKKWYPLQCDFSAMISPKLFEEYVTPRLAEQCAWLDNNIYHWDGPGEIPHLDILLEIPKLQGIQWTPGTGNPGVGSAVWFPLYKKIQEKKKLLVLLDMAVDDIENLLKEISPRGLLISSRCNSVEEANYVLNAIGKWTTELR